MKIFYRSEQSATSNKSFSPSAGKPKLFVEKAMDIFGDKIEVDDTFPPCSISEIARAHDQDFVIDVLNGIKSNGFGNKLKEVNDTLPYTSGSMKAALHYAFLNQTIACSSTSGFHHASHNSARGFCTFNGLMVAALDLLEKYPDVRIGIFDLDMHYGDGTDDIIQWKSLHEKIKHYTLGREYLTKDRVKEWIFNFPELVNKFLSDVDVVLFQAGADPHINDPLGGLFTTEDLAELHNLFFIEAVEKKIGVAWNLAGGYANTANGSHVVSVVSESINRFDQSIENDWGKSADQDHTINHVLEIHMNTMRVALSELEFQPRKTSHFDDFEEIIKLTPKISEEELLGLLKLNPGIDEITPIDGGHEVFLAKADISFDTHSNQSYQVLELKNEKTNELSGIVIKTDSDGIMMIRGNDFQIRIEYFDQWIRKNRILDIDLDYIFDEHDLIIQDMKASSSYHLYRRIKNFFLICESSRRVGIDLYGEFRHLMDCLLQYGRQDVFARIQDYIDLVCLDYLNACSG